MTHSFYISTYDCIMIDLQPDPRFWQNEPSAGNSSRTANDLAVRRALQAWAGRIAALPKLKLGVPAVFRLYYQRPPRVDADSQ